MIPSFTKFCYRVLIKSFLLFLLLDSSPLFAVCGNTVTVNIPSLRTLPALLTVAGAQGTPVYTQWVNLHLGHSRFKLDFT
ncbi:MAG: hypothetical protein INR73_21525 [Williamsia sp.]|nr:hypothetical protein [Williamsia sp.]